MRSKVIDRNVNRPAGLQVLEVHDQEVVVQSVRVVKVAHVPLWNRQTTQVLVVGVVLDE
jgi:hypothetical protein